MLFAEADKNFIGFLFHILALPVGTFIALLTKQGMVGSLGNIYESIENVSTTYLRPNVNKETLGVQVTTVTDTWLMTPARSVLRAMLL